MITNQEYFAQYMSDIQAEAGAEEDFCEVTFTEEMCDFLVEEAVIDAYDAVFYKKAQQGIRIDGWNFDKVRMELSLFISDYHHESELRNLTQTDADKFFKRAIRFFKKSISEDFYQTELDESDPAYGVARDICENQESIRKIQFYLLSNAARGERFKSLDPIKIEGYETTYDIWDISRRANIQNSGKAKEDIFIDFTEFVDGGIELLPAFKNFSGCDSYLLVFPGELVAKIYDKYGDRLLEQNVRTFLQFRGGVNKSIRNTLKNEPEMFFAYNNGLTVTAESLKIKNNRMLEAKNLQIVNGGQTTASIFMSKLYDKNLVDLTNVYVQVKLSVIDEDRVDEVVPVISRSSNTQNKVSAADFFSNHPFHKRIEDFSRRILAPAQEGKLETKWFYERARGQYANSQAKMTPSQKKKFLLQHPRHQMTTKTDIAKFENSFNEMPHFVSKGAQWNFGKFAEEISGKDEDNKGLWDKNDTQFNDLWFKNSIAKAIIFKFLEKNMMKQVWYGGYRANIITYTIAKFSYLVKNSGNFIDFSSIWKKQDLSDIMKDELLYLAEKINETITDTEENVGSYCKKNICWENVKKTNFSLSDEMKRELKKSNQHISERNEAKVKQRTLNKINTQIEVINKGLPYWTAMYSWAYESKLFTDKEMSILGTTLRMNTNPPSEKQCVIILNIEQKALFEGFFYKKN
jgi:hypothetical protein